MDDLRIQGATKPIPGLVNGKAARNKTSGFADYMKKAIENVNAMETGADKSVEQMTKGQAGIHEAMIALQKADISLRLLLQIRNKAMESYREVMRMQF